MVNGDMRKLRLVIRYSLFAIRYSPIASIALRLDDFRHGHAELFLDQYHFAAGDQAVVDVDVDRLADLAVEFEHRAGAEPQQFADLHARAPEHGRDFHRHVEHGFEVGRAVAGIVG